MHRRKSKASPYVEWVQVRYGGQTDPVDTQPDLRIGSTECVQKHMLRVRTGKPGNGEILADPLGWTYLLA